MRKRFAVEDETASFNRALIAGHLIGQGPAADDDVVRAMMLRLANGFAQGAPGVRPELAQLVVDALNDGVDAASPDPRLGRPGGPVGERRPRARAARRLRARGGGGARAAEQQRVLDGRRRAGRRRLREPARLAWTSQRRSTSRRSRPTRARSTRRSASARPYPGLRATLERLRELLDGSYLWSEPPRNLQDPLSFRSLPQVHGAARDALAYAQDVALRSSSTPTRETRSSSSTAGASSRSGTSTSSRSRRRSTSSASPSRPC